MVLETVVMCLVGVRKCLGAVFGKNWVGCLINAGVLKKYYKKVKSYFVN